MIAIITRLALLYFEFFKVGLFSIGGGLATIPFLNDLGIRSGWFTTGDVADMLAISESTPGPIGVNMATYTGFTSIDEMGGPLLGILGGIVATLGLISPAIIIILIVAKVLEAFKGSKLVAGAMYGLRAASIGLVLAAAYEVIKIALLNTDKIILFFKTMNIGTLGSAFYYKEILLAIFIFAGQKYFKKLHPIVFIFISAAVGIVFNLAA